MDWLTEPFHHEFMRRVFVGGALIGFTNGFLGAFIVLRRMALMADALSHSLLPGLAVAFILFGLAPSGLFVGALVAALLVALGAQMLARSSRLKEDTALGILYTGAFSVGVVLIGIFKPRIPLDHYLFGNILGLSNSDIWIVYGISLLVVPLLTALQRPSHLERGLGAAADQPPHQRRASGRDLLGHRLVVRHPVDHGGRQPVRARGQRRQLPVAQMRGEAQRRLAVLQQFDE